jgi:hypothetical protein
LTDDVHVPSEKQPKKIVMGKNKTKVTLHPFKKDLKKEAILNHIKALVLETKADRIGQAYSQKQWSQCYTAPYSVINDGDAPSSLKDLAMRVVIVQTEEYDMNEDMIMEKRGANYRAAGASTVDVAQHKADVQGGKDWVAKRPASHHNIVEHYNSATEHEKAFGHSWYDDAHHLTKHVANDTGTPMHTAAGIVGNHSPQNSWASNIHDAARVMRGKKGIGGTGSGIFASHSQRKADDRMLGGEHYESVMKGHKIRAFTHLIEHGGNKDPNKPHVVIDRHAAAVAHGDRITDNGYKHGLGGLSSKKLYNSYEQHYHNAAKAINAANPGAEPVHAHQVQAVTWLVRQRRNQAIEQGKSKAGKSGTSSRIERQTKDLDTYMAKEHPKVPFNIRKMSGYSSE